MCGIAGFFGSNPPETQKIQNCLALMKRRGPDAQKYSLSNVNDKSILLLHSRLSIIDLDHRSDQPMESAEQSIIFNGEIYNYIELREKMRRAGHLMNTQSDTEVLLLGMGLIGDEFLNQCEGMWAFALFDKKKLSLKLCRDRFSEKPLYIFRNKDGIYFGSEIKFLRALTGNSQSINKDHILRYLVNGYKSLYKSNVTFFNDVEELPPGQILTIGVDGSESYTKYWIPKLNYKDNMTFDEAVEGARHHLFESMKIRLRSDVPLAFCMSGGVDSVGLISIAKKIYNYDVHGFTIVNTDARYEEEDMVDLAVKKLDIRHTSVSTRIENGLDEFRKLIKQHDAPIYTITYFVHWLLMSKIAESGYKIAISGTAADEIFSGYFDHHLAYLQAISEDTDNYSNSKLAWEKYIKPIVRNPFLQDPDIFIKNTKFREHIYLDADYFRSFLTDHWSEDFSEQTYSKDLLRNRMLNELFHESVPVILHEDDLNAMYYSIENRSPFLDRSLFEFCNSIPTKHLVRDGKAKAVLREALRGIAPTEIIENRRKVGFNAPLSDLINLKDKKTKDQILDTSLIYDYVKRECIEELLEYDELPNSKSKFLFNFINSKIFLEEFSS